MHTAPVTRWKPKRWAPPPEDNSGILQYLTGDMFSAIPCPGYSAAEYTMVGAAPTRLLEDGDIIDLGDRKWQVLHTPGRSPGGLSLWEAETGSLFSGEMLYDGSHGLAWPPSDSMAYCASLRRFRDLPVARVYAGHYGSFDGARMNALIEEQLADLSES